MVQMQWLNILRKLTQSYYTQKRYF